MTVILITLPVMALIAVHWLLSTKQSGALERSRVQGQFE